MLFFFPNRSITCISERIFVNNLLLLTVGGHELYLYTEDECTTRTDSTYLAKRCSPNLKTVLGQRSDFGFTISEWIYAICNFSGAMGWEYPDSAWSGNYVALKVERILIGHPPVSLHPDPPQSLVIRYKNLVHLTRLDRREMAALTQCLWGWPSIEPAYDPRFLSAGKVFLVGRDTCEFVTSSSVLWDKQKTFNMINMSTLFFHFLNCMHFHDADQRMI